MCLDGTWPTIARSRRLQCLSPYYITGRPTSAMPADLRTIACYPCQAHDGALRRVSTPSWPPASLFAHSLAAVSNKPVHVPWDAACSCLATRRIFPTLYLGVMGVGEPGRSSWCLPTAVIYCLCTRFANSFRLWLQSLCEPAALPTLASVALPHPSSCLARSPYRAWLRHAAFFKLRWTSIKYLSAAGPNAFRRIIAVL